MMQFEIVFLTNELQTTAIALFPRSQKWLNFSETKHSTKYSPMQSKLHGLHLIVNLYFLLNKIGKSHMFFPFRLFLNEAQITLL